MLSCVKIWPVMPSSISSISVSSILVNISFGLVFVQVYPVKCLIPRLYDYVNQQCPSARPLGLKCCQLFLHHYPDWYGLPRWLWSLIKEYTSNKPYRTSALGWNSCTTSGPKDDDCDEWLKTATFVYTNNREWILISTDSSTVKNMFRAFSNQKRRYIIIALQIKFIMIIKMLTEIPNCCTFITNWIHKSVPLRWFTTTNHGPLIYPINAFVWK